MGPEVIKSSDSFKKRERFAAPVNCKEDRIRFKIKPLNIEKCVEGAKLTIDRAVKLGLFG